MTTIDWQNYFFHLVFTRDAELLHTLPLGLLSDSNAEQLVDALKNADTGEGALLWNNLVDTDWSLNGVKVIYNGNNITKLPTKYGHSYALGLLFPDRESGITGRCYLVWDKQEV